MLTYSQNQFKNWNNEHGLKGIFENQFNNQPIFSFKISHKNQTHPHLNAWN
jgi:hypothetical protein